MTNKILFVESKGAVLGARIRNSRIYGSLPAQKVAVEISANLNKEMLCILFKEGDLKGLRELFSKHKLPNAKYVFKEALLRWLKSSNKGFEEFTKRLDPSVIVAEGCITGYFCLHIAKKLGIPVITDNHSWTSWEISQKYPLIRKLISPLFESIEESVFSESSYISVASYGLKKIITDKYNVTPSKIIVACNGGDISNLKARYKVPTNIVYAGALSKQEGIAYYPLVIEKLKPQTNMGHLNFYLIGDGYERDRLFASIYEKRLEITHLGLLTRGKTIEKLAEMSVGVIFAYGVDAFPIKALDYMSVGLPIVAFDVDCLGKLIHEENVGFAVRPGDVNCYAESILSLTEKETWEEKSQNAKRAIKEKFNWAKTLERLMMVCSSVQK